MSDFEQWCILELFGHSRTAGLVTEQTIGGETFIRVDVPAIENGEAYSRLFGKGAIYSITPVTEETARKAVESWLPRPLSVWDVRELLPSPEDADES